MVSFSCEVCNDTIVKRKLAQHQRQCRGAYFTCIDCNTTFYNNEHNGHTSCISEAEKYEKGLYKGKKNNKTNKKSNATQDTIKEPVKPVSSSKKDMNDEKKSTKPSKKDENNFDLNKYVKGNNSVSLYKIFKSAKKDKAGIKDKSDLLKLLKISLKEDGSFILTI
ncbi:unnamed protein product [Ambrosiozyma monospora]|uniref:Unnamed protein product n=1 Tax=Ambrosiozyma monospora TaxID=43982 RepID=A0A9W6YXR2_AMBMO|nr:unnamed protein product [Ambrosiozyma monospora]